MRWAFSLAVLATALYQLRVLDFAQVVALIPRSPLFWVVFAISYLAGPYSEWIIFRRLWHVGTNASAPLLRKLVYNELLVGYLGEVYFYSWARRHLPLSASPFGAVKDVAVLSAVVGNVMTLAFLAAAFPLLRMLPLGDHASTIGSSLAFVIGSSLAVMLWRGVIFSLERSELVFISFVHTGRILATTGLTALLWYLVLPETPLGWWLVLATMRLLVSRLPFVPNKDVIFAGIAVFAVGQDVELAAVVAMIAALILLTHLVVGVGFALTDLANGDKNVQADG
ncbi:hypothetical protein N0B51_14520 [Tsuneonella sp. YG55]|uniref:Uncharacterized protein n=1 Tax=Tsuneonella litorea TaxID=2976475 RepID=A0A9X3ALQ8_9SPHN|nr:hypothetical protein [Tsuneonella litorea]MCT2560194.1 hypothetical protein [Tsuneonella litorea]